MGDLFQVGQVEKNFEKVARILATSTEEKQNELMLDINVDLYNVTVGDTLEVRFFESYNESYTPELEKNFRNYHYVMHGQIYKIEPARDQSKLLIYASFGGLLMRLSGYDQSSVLT